MRYLTVFAVLLLASILGATVFDTSIVASAQWSAETDEFGSSYDTAGYTVEDTLIKVNFTLSKKQGDENWPYVELIGNLDDSIDGATSIKVTYRCPKALIIKLSQDDFGWQGDKSYAFYQYKVQPALEWKTQVIPISKFHQPRWTPAKSVNIPLDLKKVKAIYFTPNLNDQVGGNAIVEIREVTLFNK